MAIPDPLATLRTILGLEATVTALAPAARIYAGELPEAEAAAQPRTAVLLQPAGGLPELGWMALAQPRVDVKCFGKTPFEAAQLSLAVHDVLKNLQRRIAAASSSGTRGLIHGAQLYGGPNALRDPDGDWPFVLRTYLLLTSDVAVP